MHTMCRKGLIACHKNNGIKIMKKHVDANHFALMKKVAKDPSIAPKKIPFGQKVSKTKANVFPFTICGFFFSK
jgi:hypothetical protein